MSINKDDKNCVVFAWGEPEDEKVTSTTHKTKSSNFSNDSITKSLIDIPNITMQYILEIKESVRKMIVSNKKKVLFSQIVGQNYAKNVLRSTFFTQYKHKVHLPRKLLFYGPSGVGKTMLTNAMTFETDRTVLRVNISQVVSRFMGETEKMLDAVFELAKENSPSLIILEEIDSIARKRSTSEPDMERRIKIELFRHLDAVKEMEECVAFMATTNLPWDLDSALLTRFEKKIFVSTPNKSDRMEMIRNLSEPYSKFSHEELTELSEISRGLTGCEFEVLFNDLIVSLSNKSEALEIEFGILKKRILQTRPSVSPNVMSNYIRFLKRSGQADQLDEIDQDLQADLEVNNIYI